jgi:hypothetical protein
MFKLFSLLQVFNQHDALMTVADVTVGIAIEKVLK